jgi:hypothetical protein
MLKILQILDFLWLSIPKQNSKQFEDKYQYDNEVEKVTRSSICSTVRKNFFFSCLSSLHINDSNLVTNDFIELVFLNNKINSVTGVNNFKKVLVLRLKIQKLRSVLGFFRSQRDHQ